LKISCDVTDIFSAFEKCFSKFCLAQLQVLQQLNAAEPANVSAFTLLALMVDR